MSLYLESIHFLNAIQPIILTSVIPRGNCNPILKQIGVKMGLCEKYYFLFFLNSSIEWEGNQVLWSF